MIRIRKLIISFCSIFLILTFFDIVLFGFLYVQTPADTESFKETIYSLISGLDLLLAIFSGVFLLIFAFYCENAHGMRWVIMSTFLAFCLSLVSSLLAMIETFRIRGTIAINDEALNSAFSYIPLLLIPFFLVGPIVAFANLRSITDTIGGKII